MTRALCLSLSLLVCGCWSSTRPQTDSKSNWLSVCDASSECESGASCICGVCTAACATASDCDRGAEPAARCAAPSDGEVPDECIRAARAAGGSICLPASRDAARDTVPAVDAGPSGRDAGPPDEPTVTAGDTGTRLLRASERETGGTCETAGIHAYSGYDDNANGVLDDAEVRDDVLTCDAPAPADGACVEPGGAAPAELVVCTSGSFAEHCPADGVQVDTGLDADRNGVLDEVEVELREYACVESDVCDETSWRELVPSLVCCDLSAVDLSSGELGGTDFTDADLHGATLTAAVLEPSCASCPAARLQCADLTGATLTDARLGGALLGAATLDHVILRRAHGEGVQLQSASLIEADLAGAHLSDAKLDHADLTGADLSGSDLQHADLRYANLGGADLTAAKLAHASLGFLRACPAKLPDRAWVCVSGIRSLCGQSEPLFALVGADAELIGANLSGRALAGMDLRGVDLSRAELGDAVLSDVDLSGANLSQANLRHAVLGYARLNGADLSNTDLRGADLEWADLTGAQLAGALTDAETLCPDRAAGPCW